VVMIHFNKMVFKKVLLSLKSLIPPVKKNVSPQNRHNSSVAAASSRGGTKGFISTLTTLHSIPEEFSKWGCIYQYTHSSGSGSADRQCNEANLAAS